MAAADSPTIADFHRRDDPATSNYSRLSDAHMVVQKSGKLASQSSCTSDVVDFGLSSAWRVPLPPPEPPPPPQPPPPPWCPPSTFSPALDSGFPQRPASHPTWHHNGTVIDPGLSLTWCVPLPPTEPPPPPQPPRKKPQKDYQKGRWKQK